MIALFRIANLHEPFAASNYFTGPLLAITILTLPAPGGLYLLPMPLNKLDVVMQTITWVMVLIFLFNHARLQGRLAGAAAKKMNQ